VKITSRDIIEILKTARDLGYREFRLEHDGLRLAASSTAHASGNFPSFAVRGASTAPAQPAPAMPPQIAPAATPRVQGTPSTSAAPTASREGLIAITAPMSGTFYRSPSPGAPPFVEIGSRVGANDIVCIIEVMKLFNSIRAGSAGTIAEIAVENEGSVVAGQQVIWIELAKD
jgi:acetyl-CoA carboxylase biotin carboxyl carrier protein